MAFDLEERLQPRTRLQEVSVLPGHRPLGKLPSRAELYEEIFRDRGRTSPPPSSPTALESLDASEPRLGSP